MIRYDICDMIYDMISYMIYDMTWDDIWYYIWYDAIWYTIWYDPIWYMIYLTIIGLTPGGSITVHNFTQTIHRTTQLIWEECGPCPVFASYTLAFDLHLRKKQGKTSVRVTEECQLTRCKQNIQNITLTTRIHIYNNKNT